MLEILEDYMRVSATPEAYDNAKKACDHLDDFELPDWETAMTDLLMTLDAVPLDEDIDRINGLLRELLTNILANFRMTVSDEVTLSQLNLVLETVRMIEHTEDTDTILSLIEQSDDPVEVFCAILAHFHGDCADNYYSYIYEVQPETIEVIRELMNKQNSFRDPETKIDVEADRQCAARLKNFLHFCQCETVLVANLIRDGARMGQPFSRYFTQVVGFVNQQKFRDAAREFLAIAVVSAEHEKPRDVIVEWLNKQYSDATVVTRLMMAVEELLLTWNNFNKSGVQKEPA